MTEVEKKAAPPEKEVEAPAKVLLASGEEVLASEAVEFEGAYYPKVKAKTNCSFCHGSGYVRHGVVQLCSCAGGDQALAVRGRSRE